jgi:protein involved in polysaccharide export with SLBB domain
MLLVGGANAAVADDGAAPVPATVEVQVLGATPHPGKYTLTEGSRLSDALAASGLRVPVEAKNVVSGDGAASTTRADLRRVFVTRTIAGVATSYQVDITRRTTDIRYDPILQQGDKIYVPELRGTTPGLIQIVAGPDTARR